jgi:hypothetical protein
MTWVEGLFWVPKLFSFFVLVYRKKARLCFVSVLGFHSKLSTMAAAGAIWRGHSPNGLVGNSDFWFWFLGPPSEAEFWFRFWFQRFPLDFFLNSAVENSTNQNSDSKNSPKKLTNERSTPHFVPEKWLLPYLHLLNAHCCHTYIYSTPIPPYLHPLNACPAIPSSTQCLSHHTYIYSMPIHIYSTPVPPYLHLLTACCCYLKKRRRERFLIHEIRRIDGGRGFWTGRNVFRVGGNTFYDRKIKFRWKFRSSKGPELELLWNSEQIHQKYKTRWY